MPTPEYWRLTGGQRVDKETIEWENPIGMANVNKLIREGLVIGEDQFDLDMKVHTIYFMPSKLKCLQANKSII